MIYKVAKEKNFHDLALMRWDFKTENRKSDYEHVNKEEFLRECVDFFCDGDEDGTWTHWIAIKGEEVVSHISVNHIRKVPKPSRFRDEYAYLTNVYTKPKHRGKGIGSTLMDQVKNWASDHDFEIMIVWPSSEAVQFYERKGFKSVNDVMELTIRDDI